MKYTTNTLKNNRIIKEDFLILLIKFKSYLKKSYKFNKYMMKISKLNLLYFLTFQASNQIEFSKKKIKNLTLIRGNIHLILIEFLKSEQISY